MIYYLVFSISLISAFFSKKRRYDKFILPVALYVALVLFLSLFSSLRGLNVGSDTAVYHRHFVELSAMPLSNVVVTYKKDFGFYLFTSLFGKLIPNYNAYLLFISLLYLIPVFILINRKSKRPLLSIFLFFALGLFTFSLSTIRQTMAMSLCVIAYLFVDKKKYIFGLLFCFLAATIHYSSLVFLLFFVLSKIKIKPIPIIIMCVLVIPYFFASQYISVLLNYIANKGSYGEYGTDSVGGFGMVVFLSFLFIFSAFIKLKNRCNDIDSRREIALLYLTLIVFELTRYNFAMMRLYYYFLLFVIIVVPNVANDIKRTDLRVSFLILVSVVSLYYLVFNVFANAYGESSKLLPYVFWWE